MTLIREHAALQDAWVETHPNPPASSSMLSPFDCIQAFGVTADSPINSYSAGKPLDSYARAGQGKRLDYVLFRNPSAHSTGSSKPLPQLKCSNTRVMLTETVPGRSFSYSDHFGLEARFDISHAEAQEGTLPSNPSRYSSDFPSTSSVAAPTPPSTSTHLSSEDAMTVVQALTTCYRHARVRSQHELTIFMLCVVLLVGLIIGAAWLPHAAYSPVFVFLAGVATWLGTTMLYVGFVYGKWEVNALMNVIEELELYRKGLDEGLTGH